MSGLLTFRSHHASADRDTAESDAFDAHNFAVGDAGMTLTTSEANAQMDYDDALMTADTAYESAISAYESDVDMAIADVQQKQTDLAHVMQDVQPAIDARDAAYEAALATLNAGIASAQDDYDTAEAAAYADYETAMAEPNEDWETAEGAAWAIYLSDKSAADTAFETAEANAWSAYLADLALIEAALASDELDVEDEFDLSVTGFDTQWETDEAEAWDDYETAMGNLPGSPAMGLQFEEPAPVEDDGILEFVGFGLGPILPTLAQLLPVFFTVNTTNDTPDFDAQDRRARDENNQTSLRAAIDEGNRAWVGNRTVIITFDLPQESTINLGRALAPLAANFIIAGSGYGIQQVTIRRNAAANFRIFTIEPLKTVVISHVTIANGSATGAGDNSHGGGIMNYGNLTVDFVNIEGNRAASNGGAIANIGGNLTVIFGEMLDNEALGHGGGIYNDGTAVIRGEADIKDNRGLNGGGIYNAASRQLTILDGVTIQGNRATGTGVGLVGRGGGIANLGALTMDNAAVIGNRSVNSGGGLYNSGNAWLTTVYISDNHATDVTRGKGGGIYAGFAGLVGYTELTTGCTLTGNTAAASGPGISFSGLLDASTTLNEILDAIVQDTNP